MYSTWFLCTQKDFLSPLAAGNISAVVVVVVILALAVVCVLVLLGIILRFQQVQR